jgi:hypothetical protein
VAAGRVEYSHSGGIGELKRMLMNPNKLMNESLPPPLPSGPRPRGVDDQQSVTPSSRGADPTYNLLADKIGGVPNIRKKDNLYQAAAIGVFLIVGAVVGCFSANGPRASCWAGWPDS